MLSYSRRQEASSRKPPRPEKRFVKCLTMNAKYSKYNLYIKMLSSTQEIFLEAIFPVRLQISPEKLVNQQYPSGMTFMCPLYIDSASGR